MSSDSHTLKSEAITATVKADGAELCSLKNAAGTELLWQAGPQWPRHAPLLFPIVGRLKNDELRLRGKTYAMTQHGFARDQRFEWLEREPASCKLLLADSEATRARYPFTFRLEATFTVNGADLDVVLDVTNTGGSAAGVDRRASGIQLAANARSAQGRLHADLLRCGDRADPTSERRPDATNAGTVADRRQSAHAFRKAVRR